MWWRRTYLLALMLLLTPGLGNSQDPSVADTSPRLEQLVEFRFTASPVTEVIEYVVQLTGWSVFYDAERVTGKITIVTPGKIPLRQALRILQGVMQPYAAAVWVLPPGSARPLSLAGLLEGVTPSVEERQAVVLRSSNARGPQSRPYVCEPTASPLFVPWRFDVLVDRPSPRR